MKFLSVIAVPLAMAVESQGHWKRRQYQADETGTMGRLKVCLSLEWPLPCLPLTVPDLCGLKVGIPETARGDRSEGKGRGTAHIT